MVYALPLYHPIRMIEEICMLDQMSHGRLEMGFGRGSVRHRARVLRRGPELAQEVYAEALELVLKGLTEPVLTFHGKFFNFDNVPMELAPLQKPLSAGVVRAACARKRQARRAQGLRVISLDPVPATRAAFDAFRDAWREAWHAKPLPLMGLGRFIVVAETDAEALALARRAYPRWHDNFTHLHRLHNYSAMHPRPPQFDGIARGGAGCRGLARHRGGIPARAAGRDRQQLLCRAIRLWRPVACRYAALDRAVRARGYAEIAERRAGRRGLIFIAPSL